MTRRFALLPLLLLSTACASLPPAPPHAYVPPRLSPDTAVEVCWLEIAGTTGAATFGSAGWSRGGTWDATASALLIRHPQGDLLLDAGISPFWSLEHRELSLWTRAGLESIPGRLKRRGSLPDLLRQANADPRALKAVLISHAHVDHTGGVVELPGVPVWLAAEERRYVEESKGFGVIPAHARSMAGRMVAFPFTDTPYANYDRSYDVFGDGAVVVVPAPGHTPGSVMVFVNLSATRRLVHIGDIFSTRESLDRNVGKSRVMSVTDADGDQVHAQGARLVQLHRMDPALSVLPAHDRGAYEAFFGPMPKAGASPRCVRP